MFTGHVCTRWQTHTCVIVDVHMNSQFIYLLIDKLKITLVVYMIHDCVVLHMHVIAYHMAILIKLLCHDVTIYDTHETAHVPNTSQLHAYLRHSNTLIVTCVNVCVGNGRIHIHCIHTNRADMNPFVIT